MNKLILSILIVIILTGCNKSLNDPLSQLEGKVIVNGEQYTMILSDYEQKEDKVEFSSKHSSDINEIAEHFDTLEVEKSTIFKFEIDTNPSSITVSKLNEDGTTDLVEVKDNEIMMPLESGYYIYQLKTIWSEGKQTFVFDVSVE
ncbi:hypothetical protein ACQKMV_14990 [Lysinibacillus sp. NPDC094403]|uniref:hypothetical protein n=1 Tax=Lysinibacillus sp. NPDC094403 TaxID=3390581 RepID=UPI003D0805EC